MEHRPNPTCDVSQRGLPRSGTSRLLPLCLISLTLLAAGCTNLQTLYCATNQSCGQCVYELRCKAKAAAAWRSCYASCYRRHSCRAEIRRGFIDGYVSVCMGGDGCPPACPRPHCSLKYLLGRNCCCSQAWYEGFPLGAAAGERSGFCYCNPARVAIAPEILACYRQCAQLEQQRNMNHRRWSEPREVNEDVLNSSSDRQPVPIQPKKSEMGSDSEKDKDAQDNGKSAPPIPESLKDKSAGTPTWYQPVIRSSEETYIPTAEEYEEAFSEDWDDDSESGIIEGPSIPLQLTRSLKFQEFQPLPTQVQPTRVASASWSIEDISSGMIR